jgi:hypothetical protein
MLEVSPGKRVSASKALEHEIFRLGGDSAGTGSRKAQVVLEGLLHYRVRLRLYRSK